MHSYIRVALFILCLLLVFPAHAQNSGDDPWSGWYAGAFGGYLNGKLTSNDESHFETTGEFEDNSPIFGIFAGKNHQTTSGWVIGVEVLLPLYLDKGTAVDTEFYPDANPRVTYEADYKWSVLAGIRAGKPRGDFLPYVTLALGLAKADGKTINLDNDNVYMPGAEQSASATHLVYQAGVGADYLAGQNLWLGLKILAFNSNKKQYEMPWNEGELNSFGLNSLVVQAQVTRRF